MAKKRNLIGCQCGPYLHYLGLPEVYQRIAHLGLKYAEINAEAFSRYGLRPEIMDDADIANERREMRKWGISPMSVAGHTSLYKKIGPRIFRHRIDLTAKLGVQVCTTFCSTKHDLAKKELHRMYDVLRELGDYAAERGVTIALEIHGGLTPNGKQCLKLMKILNHDQVRINYDTGNVFFYNRQITRGEQELRDLEIIAPYVAHVHLKDSLYGKYQDWNFCTLGEGKVDFPGVFRILNKAGFYGPFSIEVEGVAGEERTVDFVHYRNQLSVEYLRSIGAL